MNKNIFNAHKVNIEIFTIIFLFQLWYGTFLDLITSDDCSENNNITEKNDLVKKR